MTKVNGKQKGSRGEREAAKLLVSLGYEARRTQQFCGNSGDSADLKHNIPNVRIEVKLGYDKAALGSKTVAEWLSKLQGECSATEKPFILWRKTRMEWTAILIVQGLVVQTADVAAALKLVSQ